MHVYLDGSCQVNHGSTEMGQGLNTRVCQTVADELGIAFEQVLATTSDTSKLPNALATAASASTDLNARAAQYAARNVRDSLAQFVAGLWSDGFYRTPKIHDDKTTLTGRPFY